MVAEAGASGFTVEAVWRRDEIGDEAMSRISLLKSPPPVLAVVRQQPETGFSMPRSGLFLALDGIRDPGNLGTLLRIADWFGLDGVFASDDTVERYNPKVVQATMGALFRMPFHTASIPGLCKDFRLAGGHVYGTFLDGVNLYDRPLETGSDSPSLIIIGNEANGISPEVSAEVSDRLLIPPFPQGRHGSESLNAAAAAAIVISEFRRRSLSTI